jgi:hypothetical protein
LLIPANFQFDIWLVAGFRNKNTKRSIFLKFLDFFSLPPGLTFFVGKLSRGPNLRS